MIQIISDFIGGNIKVLKIYNGTVLLKNELRDTAEDWFYWAFCVKGAAGKTLQFQFVEQNRVGYYGAAVSSDLSNWRWSESKGEGESFTYTFGPDENKVYFAHHMLYHPNQFEKLAQKLQLPVQILCISEKGRAVPCVEFGSGNRYILLTSRHHACESTGNYVLEGILEALIETPIAGFRFLCVPFVDYDGVVDGDQGKSRIPHDHNRDYDVNTPAIYSSVRAIRAFAQAHSVVFGFDFHSPWHIGGENDTVFIVQKNPSQIGRLNQFGEILEHFCDDGDALCYRHSNDIAPNVSWNRADTPCFANFVSSLDTSDIAFTLETAYFGKDKFFPIKAINTGKRFVDALQEYIKTTS